MAKKRNRARASQRGARRQPRIQNQPSAQGTASQPEESIKNEHEKALNLAREESLEGPALTDQPQPEGTDIDALWKIVREARGTYEALRQKFESRNQELDTRSAQLKEREQRITAGKEELTEREKELEEERTALDKRHGEASEREQALLDRETSIRQREINAECGFSKERQEILSKLDEAREAFRIEFTDKWQAGEARLKEREQALDELGERLATERRELEKDKRRLEFVEADLKELRADLERRAEQRAAAIREDFEHRNRSLEEQLTQARSDRDRHEEMLRQRENSERKFGQRTPEEVLEDLDELRTENDKLKAELAARPDIDSAARLADLERERHAWQAERVELNRKVSEYRQRCARIDTDANERETQRDVIASLKNQRELLQEGTQGTPEAEVEDLHHRSESQTPFPACTGMDENPEFQDRSGARD